MRRTTGVSSPGLELEQEPLVVLVGDADEALQQRRPLARAEAEHVDVHEALPAGRLGTVRMALGAVGWRRPRFRAQLLLPV